MGGMFWHTISKACVKQGGFGYECGFSPARNLSMSKTIMRRMASMTLQGLNQQPANHARQKTSARLGRAAMMQPAQNMLLSSERLAQLCMCCPLQKMKKKL